MPIENFESLNKSEIYAKHQVKAMQYTLMNKNALIDLLQAINFDDMIRLVNTAVVGGVGADESDPTADT